MATKCASLNQDDEANQRKFNVLLNGQSAQYIEGNCRRLTRLSILQVIEIVYEVYINKDPREKNKK